MANKGEVEFECQEEGVKIDIDGILGLCNRAKPIKFQDNKINEINILQFDEKSKKIIYGNSSHLKVRVQHTWRAKIMMLDARIS